MEIRRMVGNNTVRCDEHYNSGDIEKLADWKLSFGGMRNLRVINYVYLCE